MKQTITLLLMLIVSYSVWAQKTDTPNEKSLNPIVIEGNVENVPDGIIVVLGVRRKPYQFYTDNEKIEIKDRKFRIVHSPKDDDEEYFLRLTNFPFGLLFYASPDTKTVITGKGADIEAWRVENDNPLQKIANEYRAWQDLKVPDYFDLRKKNEWMDRDDDEYPNVEKAYNESQRKRAECMVDYMADKPYNSVLMHNLWLVACHAHITDNEDLKARIRPLLSKIPFGTPDQKGTELGEIHKFISPRVPPLGIGDKIEDFILYDHDGKEHHLTEYNGNGKYLLLEFNSRTCHGCMEHRQYDALNNLFKNHSDKADIVMINLDDPYFWAQECKDPKKWGRDQWNEWNDKKGGEDLMNRYGVRSGPSYFFISPDGNILGRISDKENLQDAIQKYFELSF